MAHRKRVPSLPTTPGERLAALRIDLGASQDLIAALGGLQRIDVVRIEGDKAKGQSTRLIEGLAKAYSMTYEQFRAYMSGAMSKAQAVLLAKAAVEHAKLQAETRRSHDELLEQVFEKASAKTELLTETRHVARALFDRVGFDLPFLMMVRQVVALNDAVNRTLDGAVRECKGDRSVPK